MPLDEVLEHNRGFVRGRASRPLPDFVTLRLAVVACYDPRLDDLLPSALGLVPGKTFFLRAAGTVVRPDGDPLRSLALAVYMFGVTEVLVVGHTSCRMAIFETPHFIDAFRARGVVREAFGTSDLREWVGAIPDPRRGVAASVGAICAARFLPKDLSVAGLVLDDTTGALEVVVAPGTAISSPAPVETAATAPPPETAKPAVAEVVAHALPREADALRAFVESLELTAWKNELASLREELARTRSPLARLGLVERFLKRSAGDAQGIVAAFDRLKRENLTTGRALEAEQLINLFRTGGKSTP